MNDNIQELYYNLKTARKKEIIKLLSENFDIRPDSILNHWFSGFKIIPKNKREETVRIIQNYYKKNKL